MQKAKDFVLLKREELRKSRLHEKINRTLGNIRSQQVDNIKSLRNHEFIEINSDSNASKFQIEDQEIGIDNTILELLQKELNLDEDNDEIEAVSINTLSPKQVEEMKSFSRLEGWTKNKRGEFIAEKIIEHSSAQSELEKKFMHRNMIEAKNKVKNVTSALIATMFSSAPATGLNINE